MLEIKAIKTKNGMYITDADLTKTYWSSYLYDYYTFNGKKCSKTFDQYWFYVDEDIKSVEKITHEKVSDIFVLKDETFQSERIPLSLDREKVLYDNDDDEWKYEFENIKSLYERKTEFKEVLIPVEFTLDVIVSLDVDKIPNPADFYAITKEVPQHPLLAKIIYPKIVHQFTEAKYTSEQVYKILRSYIKEYIDKQYAKITSDYDFCFQVDKVIPLTEPHSYDTIVNVSKRKTKVEKRYVNSRTVKIFEMTHDKDKYKGYTPVKELIAENEEKLNELMITICENTIRIINEPLVDCPTCKGTGVVNES